MMAKVHTCLRVTALLLLGMVPVGVTLAHALAEAPEYQSEVAANYRAIQGLRTGMSRAELEAAIGHEPTLRYDRLQLHRPWRREKIRSREGLEVEVLYYVTQGDVWRTGDPRHALTPVVLENGLVTGWGWRFLDRNRERYPPQSTESR
jgi:hypothetical protein